MEIVGSNVLWEIQREIWREISSGAKFEVISKKKGQNIQEESDINKGRGGSGIKMRSMEEKYDKK